MNVYRYINNSDTDVISGAYLVPAYDQLMYSENQPVLDALVGNSLVGLLNGVLIESVTQEEVKPVVKESKPEVKPKLEADI